MDGKKVEQISTKMKGLKFLSGSKDINILLLGETGVGKSTFINAVANYSIHDTWNNATASDDLDVLIPYEFTVTDKNERYHRITSQNCEYLKSDIKSYVFPLPAGKNVRLIDTPHVDDNINLENILSYISQFNTLDAICYVTRPEEHPNPLYLEQILSKLDKSVGKNLMFAVTNARESCYKPGSSLQMFKGMENILLDENKNVFCFDNEPFRYLAAVKQNVEFEDSVIKYNIDNWNKSNDSWWSLIKYTTRLSPLFIKSTISINEVQRFILQLSQPLIDAIQYINDQLFALEEQHLLFLKTDNFDELKANLFIPFIDLDIQKLTKPVTVCAALKCCSIYELGNLIKRQYNAPCHDSCYLKNIPKDLIGSTELLSCDEIDSKFCKQCGCDFSTHKHIYYICTTVQLSANVPTNIETKEETLEKATELAAEIMKIKREMEDERYKLISVMARCAYFIRENSLTPFNDIYKDYMKFLIRRATPISTDSCYDGKNLQELNNLLQTYEELLDVLKEGFTVHEKLRKDEKYLSYLEVHKDITNLFSLKHVGKKVKELYHSQKTARKKMLDKTELIHPSCFAKQKNDSPIDSEIDINETSTINEEDNENSEQMNRNQNTRKENRSKSYRQKNGRENRPRPPPYSAVDPKVGNLEPSQSYVPPNPSQVGCHYPPPGHSSYFPPGSPGYFPPRPPGYFPPGPSNSFLPPQLPGPYQPYSDPHHPPYTPYAPAAYYPDPRGAPNPYPLYTSKSNDDKNAQECEITVKFKPGSNNSAPPSLNPSRQPKHFSQQPLPSQPMRNQQNHPNTSWTQKFQTQVKSKPNKNWQPQAKSTTSNNSQPHVKCMPSKNSQPQVKSTPSSHSQPQMKSTPNKNSQPQMKSIPNKNSHPQMKSTASRNSQPQTKSTPNKNSQTQVKCTQEKIEIKQIVRTVITEVTSTSSKNSQSQLKNTPNKNSHPQVRSTPSKKTNNAKKS